MRSLVKGEAEHGVIYILHDGKERELFTRLNSMTALIWINRRAVADGA
jgi:hypothetical protein